MSEESFEAKFPENCGFARFVIDSDKDFRNFPNQSSLECILCKPGFRAVRNGNSLITRCE